MKQLSRLLASRNTSAPGSRGVGRVSSLRNSLSQRHFSQHHQHVADSSREKKSKIVSSTSSPALTKSYKVRGVDNRLFLLEENQEKTGGGGGPAFSVAVGDIIYNKYSDPVGVVLFQAHGGLYFGGSISPANDDQQELFRDGDDVEIHAEKKLGLCPHSVDYESPFIDSLDACKVFSSSDSSQFSPVFRPQPRDVDREIILEGWSVGIPSVDALTPLGRGQSMLFTTKYSQNGTDRRDELILDSALGALRNDFNADLHIWYALSAPSSMPSILSKRKELSNRISEAGFPSKNTIVSTKLFEREGEDMDTLSLLNSYIACTLAELRRDRGEHAMLLLPDLQAQYLIWRRSQRLAADYYKETKGTVPSNLFAPGFDRADLRHFYSTLIQRTAKLKPHLGGGTLSMLQGVYDNGKQQGKSSANESEEQVYLFREVALDKSTSPHDLNRLKMLDDRGIPLTRQTLLKLGIEPPVGSDSANVEKLWGLTGDLVTSETQTQHAEELKSISDGHLVVAENAEELFDFDIRNSLTRIGIGINKKRSRDTRPYALRQVAQGLRLRLSEKLDTVVRGEIPQEIKQYSAALRQHHLGMSVEHEALLFYGLSLGVQVKDIQDIVIPRELVDVIKENQRYLTEQELKEMELILQNNS